MTEINNALLRSLAVKGFKLLLWGSFWVWYFGR